MQYYDYKNRNGSNRWPGAVAMEALHLDYMLHNSEINRSVFATVLLRLIRPIKKSKRAAFPGLPDQTAKLLAHRTFWYMNTLEEQMRIFDEALAAIPVLTPTGPPAIITPIRTRDGTRAIEWLNKLLSK